MNRTKYLKGACQHCGGHLEFPAEHIGMVATCPHCQQETELLLLPPPDEPAIPRRVLIWTGIAVVILALGFGGALIALKRAQRWAERQKRQSAEAIATAQPPTNTQAVANEPAASSNDALAPSPVTLQKTPGSSLVYGVGTLKNSSDRRRYGIKVELELLDGAGQKIGTASDYCQVLEPGAKWQFKALVLDSQAVSARIASIQEDR